MLCVYFLMVNSKYLYQGFLDYSFEYKYFIHYLKVQVSVCCKNLIPALKHVV